MGPLEEYLNPTYLCDFDRSPEIQEAAQELTIRLSDKQEMLDHIYRFVKELPYGLEDWDVLASETLRKGWGMCLGKSNLMVAMLRTSHIPARYRVFNITSEGTLWRWIAGEDVGLAAEIGDPSPKQDHVVVEVKTNGWQVYDPSRDSPLEKGMKMLGIPLERRPVSSTSNSSTLILVSIDEWAWNRQQARRFRRNRHLIFSKINRELDKIRALGTEGPNLHRY